MTSAGPARHEPPPVEGEAEFRRRVRRFLAEHAVARAEMGEAPAYVDRELAVAFQAALADAGLAGLTVARRYGGAGLDARHVEIFNEEAADYWLPTGLFTITLGMCVPVLLQFGTEAQRQAHIPRMLRGAEIWCQMFSEPDAGSDLASLRTRAVRDGDTWVIDGQKVWTSSAHYAAFGMCLARTDPERPKHQGLSMFMVPMDTPGIEIRPLVLMTGEHGFNEVHCTGVRIPSDHLIGQLNEGWKCATAMLMNERVALGASASPLVSGRAGVVIELARATGCHREPQVRQALADLWIHEEALRHLGLRIRAAQRAGRSPGPEGSIAKLLGSEIMNRAAAAASLVLGARAQAYPRDDREAADVARSILHAPSMSIAGGTSEIQRNIIGERVLGLAREPSPGSG